MLIIINERERNPLVCNMSCSPQPSTSSAYRQPPTADQWDEAVASIRGKFINLSSISDYRALKKTIDSVITKLLRHIQTTRNILSVARKRHLETALANLKSLKLQAAHESLKIPATSKGMGLRSRVKRPQPIKVNRSDRIEWHEIAKAFKGRIRTGVIINKVHKSPRSFLEDSVIMIERRINNCLKTTMISIKVNLIFCALFEKLGDNAELTDYKYFSTPNFTFTRGNDNSRELLRKMSDDILAKVRRYWFLQRMI